MQRRCNYGTACTEYSAFTDGTSFTVPATARQCRAAVNQEALAGADGGANDFAVKSNELFEER